MSRFKVLGAEFLAFVILLCVGSCSSRTSDTQCSEEEQNEWDDEFKNWEEEHEETYHRKYFKSFLERLVKDPTTFNLKPADFLDTELVHVVDSRDKKIRFYTWDYVDGGNSYTWHNAIQYSKAGKMMVVNNSLKKIQCPETIDDNRGAYVDTVYIEKTDDNQKIYLVQYNNCHHSFPQIAIIGYYFREGALTQGLCFKKDGEYLDYIYAEDETIYFDKKTKSFYFGNSSGSGSYGRYEVYRFNGTIFEYKGVDGGFWLYPTLRDFEELELSFETESYRIRIDRIRGNIYRYTCWSRKKKESDKPDLVIRECLTDTSEGRYVFHVKKEYVYEVTSNFEEEELVVKHKGKVLLKQQAI